MSLGCGYRHWFSYYGAPGSSAPVCQRCGAPNPRYRPQADVTEAGAGDVRDQSNQRLRTRYEEQHVT